MVVLTIYLGSKSDNTQKTRVFLPLKSKASELLWTFPTLSNTRKKNLLSKPVTYNLAARKYKEINRSISTYLPK